MSERDAAATARTDRGMALMNAIVDLVGQHTRDGVLDGPGAIIATAQATGVVAALVVKPGHLDGLLKSIAQTVRESAEIHLAERARQQ